MSHPTQYHRLLSAPSSSNPPPTPVPQATPEQLPNLEKLIAYFGDEGYRLPKEGGGVLEGAEGGLMDEEKMFLSQEGILRFLVARKNDYPATVSQLEKALRWRRSSGVYNVQETADKVESEYIHTGGQFTLGYARTSQPLIIMIPSRRDKPATELGLTHLFYLFERAIELMPKGVGKVTFLIDFSGKRKHSTPVSYARQWVDILQNCYPERLGLGMIVNIPWVISLFITGALTFADPLTKSKVLLNPSLTDIPRTIPSDHLLKLYGGTVLTGSEDDQGSGVAGWGEEVHRQYWGALLEVTGERRRVRERVWREMGAGVGQSEDEWKWGEGWGKGGDSKIVVGGEKEAVEGKEVDEAVGGEGMKV